MTAPLHFTAALNHPPCTCWAAPSLPTTVQDYANTTACTKHAAPPKQHISRAHGAPDLGASLPAHTQSQYCTKATKCSQHPAHPERAWHPLTWTCVFTTGLLTLGVAWALLGLILTCCESMLPGQPLPVSAVCVLSLLAGLCQLIDVKIAN